MLMLVMIRSRLVLAASPRSACYRLVLLGSAPARGTVRGCGSGDGGAPSSDIAAPCHAAAWRRRHLHAGRHAASPLAARRDESLYQTKIYVPRTDEKYRVPVISAKNHKRQRHKRQCITAKRKKVANAKVRDC